MEKVNTETPDENKPAIEILLVEDSPEAVILMKVLMRQSRFPIHWNVASDGEETLAILRDPRNFSDKKLPDLILLDLGMPKMNGHEVLAEIRKDENLKNIPVLIMTNSTNDRDISSAYEHKANFYLVKPQDIEHSTEMVKYIEDFWLQNIR